MPFDIGLVMAGAVSAGAYTAGAIDFLLQALDTWYAEKGINHTPRRHQSTTASPVPPPCHLPAFRLTDSIADRSEHPPAMSSRIVGRNTGTTAASSSRPLSHSQDARASQ